MSIRRRELEWWYEQRRCGDGDVIEVGGNIYHGKLIDGKGDFQDQKNGYSYAGGVKDGKPHGFGVLTGSSGATESGEWFEGDFHGCMVGRYPGGDVVYWEYDHGNCMHSVLMRASGSCELDRQPCSADDVRFVALKAAALCADVRHLPPRSLECLASAIELFLQYRKGERRSRSPGFCLHGRRARSDLPRRRRPRSRCAAARRYTHTVVTVL
jgi:hypothetical protein